MSKKFRHSVLGSVTMVHEQGDKVWIIEENGTNWVVDRSCLTEEPRVWDEEDVHSFLSDLSDVERALYAHIPFCTERGGWAVYRIALDSKSIYRFDAEHREQAVREGKFSIKNGQLSITNSQWES